MLKKYTPIILFIIGLLISLLLGYAAWDSGFLQSAEDKKTEEQLAANKKAAEEKAAEDKLAKEIAAVDKAAAEKAAAEQKLAEEKAAAEKAVAEQKLAEEKAAAEKAAAEQKLAEEKAAAEKAAAEQKLAEEKAAAEKAAAEQKLAEEKAAAEKAAAEQKLAEEKAAAEKAAAELKLAEEKAAAEKAAAEQKLAEEKAAAEKAAAEKAAALNIEAIQSAMSFDILRIEPTGDAVIAGLAPAGTKVEIVNALTQNSVVADSTASSSGEFAIVLDKPLSEGKHELYIQARDEANNKFISNEIALIEVFTASLNKIPVVILSKAGAATRILQGEETQATQENTNEETEQAQAETTEETAETEQTETKPETINAVFIKAADIEGDNLIIAGAGPADSTLNIYIDDQLLGQVKISDNDTFIFEKAHSLEAGRHSIRADRIDATTNKVLGRAEVTLIHEPQIAAVEEETTQPASTEEASTSEQATSENAGATEEVATPESTTEETVTEDTTQETSTEQASSEDANAENAEEAKEEIRTGTTVIIRRGDSLWRVSRKNYGQGVRFTTIFEANKDQIKNPNLIYPGQVLNIPASQ